MNEAANAMAKCGTCRTRGFEQLHKIAVDALAPNIASEIDKVSLVPAIFSCFGPDRFSGTFRSGLLIFTD
jgi:hypothetical protein